MLKMYYEEDERKKAEGSLSSKKPSGSLDLFHDPAMEQFFTSGVRGGQSFISTREARGVDDPKASGEHLLYVDGNKY